MARRYLLFQSLEHCVGMKALRITASTTLEGQPALFGPEVGLLGVALLWGLTYPLIRMSLREMTPLVFVAHRFLLATLAFLPFICLNRRLRQEVMRALPIGLMLGFIASIFFITQTMGLRTVESPRAAFLTGTYVLMVPLLSPLFRTSHPSRVDWVSAGLAVVGLFLLLNPHGRAPGLGDGLILVCAFFVSIHIHLMQRVAKHQFDPVALTFLQIVGVTTAALIFSPIAPTQCLKFTATAWVGLCVCAVVVTIGAFLLQATLQKRTTPQRTAVMFSLEPVFASALGYLLLGEGLTARSALGATILFLSPLMPIAWRQLSRSGVSPQPALGPAGAQKAG